MSSSIALSDLSTERGCLHVFNCLLDMPDDELAQQDIAVMNLVCAAGLPSADPLDVPKCLQQLDEWAEYARQETVKGYPRYLRNPNPNKGSEAVYKLWALMHAIRTGFGLEAKLAAAVSSEIIDKSMKATGGPYPNRLNSQVSFIHGLLSPRRNFCCATIPVLFAALGRRLGYPIRLVLTAQHIFNRWVSPAEEFNMDGSMSRIGSDEYHHYIDRNRKWLPDERAVLGTIFHRPIASREELATFIFGRSNCLCANLRFDESYKMCKIAHDISPLHPAYRRQLSEIEFNRDLYNRHKGRDWTRGEEQFMIQGSLPTSFGVMAFEPLWSDPIIDRFQKRRVKS